MLNREKDSFESIAKKSDVELKKGLGLHSLFLLSVAGTLGSGWLLGAVAACSIAGPASIISWILGGVLIFILALTYAEISAAIPKSGSLVRYPNYTYGSFVGYIFGWAYLLYVASLPTIEAESVLTYAAAYIPGIVKNVSGVAMLTPLGILYGFILMFLFFLINWFGIKFFALVNNIATWIKIVIPILTIVALFFIFHKENFIIHGGFSPFGIKNIFYALPASGIIFAYEGFRQAIQFGGEAKKPQRDIPFAIFSSLVVEIIIYVLLSIVFIGAINWHTGLAWDGLTHTALGTGAFFVELKNSGMMPLIIVSYLVLAVSFIGPAGVGWTYLGSSGRALYGMAADGYFSTSLLKIHKKTKIPYIALIVGTLISLIFFLPFPSWYTLVGFVSSTGILTYIIGPLSLVGFRKYAPDMIRPFRLPMASIIAPIAFVTGSLLIYWSGTQTITMVLYIVLIGVPVFYFFYAPKFLKLSKNFLYTVGITEFVFTAFSFVVNYIFVFNPDFKESLFTKTIIYTISLILIAIIWFSFTAIISFKVSSEHKKQFKSSYWFFGLIFITAFVSYFGAFGIDPVIKFPYDTLLMSALYFAIYFFAINSIYKTAALQEAVKEKQLKY